MSTKTRLEPQPSDLQPPWRTAARVELQLEARTFARDIVLPIAVELDPQKGEMPRSLIDEMAASSVLPFQPSTAVWARGVRILPCLGGTCPRLAFGRQHLGAGPGTRYANDRQTPVGSNSCVVRPRANGSGQSLYLSQPPADLAAVQIRDIRQDGYWLLSGTKRWAGFARRRLH